jgi:diguanylate cyclase
VPVTISCGISQFREEDSPERVFERADEALYQAKRNGRNQCYVLDGEGGAA